MNIAFICTEKLPSPAVKGGAIQMMIDGVLPFLSEKHKMTIFSVSDPSLPDVEEGENVTYIRASRHKYVQHVAAKLAEQPPFDVIHIFNRPKAVPAYKAASPKSQFVLSLHNEMFAEHKLSDEEGQKAIDAVSAIMTVSHYIKGTIIHRFPEANDKIHVVYSGVDLAQFEPKWTEEGQRISSRLKEKYGISKHSKIILFIGRLSQTKGPHLLIQALPKILEMHPDAVLVICGGKWFSDNRLNDYVRMLHKLAKPLGDHVRFTKYIPHEEIPHSYLLGDVFVCSSQWQEPLARVHYEAMAAGVPLITTKRGGNAEVITHMHNGLVLKNFNNPANFAAAICDIFNHPDKAMEFSITGRKFVERNHQFIHVADRLEKVYLNAFEELSSKLDQQVINHLEYHDEQSEPPLEEEIHGMKEIEIPHTKKVKPFKFEPWVFDRTYPKRKR
ncbi:glycosyltransferase family 4 protein [Alkalihalobacillus macyae]|uniref:glycosyltransferase family 4 protein n=1 Tax=Guptibacillus hwajinpoensis TaxID=208199 RepID=UPI00273C56C8|nr:glycosyltransferase family 4 protein [Alkalihalobacillus macyae]MDP4550820.1 glycosyltransferase family 4 protein [Alkalihalobacillus macyae]